MAWYYNIYSGELANESGVSGAVYGALGVAGWKALKISSSATFAQAAADALQEYPGSPAPTGSTTTGVAQALGRSGALGIAGSAATGGTSSGSGGGASGTCAVTVAGYCLLTKTQARAIIAGLIIAGSAIIGIAGVTLIAVQMGLPGAQRVARAIPYVPA